MASTVKHCIFCGKTPLTQEHIFADWLKKYIPKIHVRHEFQGYSERRQDGAWIPKSERRGHRTGNPFSWKVKCVCKKCNEVWMGDIQEDAEPVLVPLFQGRTTTLNKEAQSLVASWITMATMVAEFDKRNDRAVPEKDLQWFYKQRTPPAHTWKIWIGRYFTFAPAGHYWHTTLPISSPEHVPEGGDPDFPYSHTQTTTFVVGQLYAHVFSCPIPDLVKTTGIGRRGDAVMTQIWPVIDDPVRWPKDLMTDRDASNLIVSIFNGFRSIPPGPGARKPWEPN